MLEPDCSVTRRPGRGPRSAFPFFLTKVPLALKRPSETGSSPQGPRLPRTIPDYYYSKHSLPVCPWVRRTRWQANTALLITDLEFH